MFDKRWMNVIIPILQMGISWPREVRSGDLVSQWQTYLNFLRPKYVTQCVAESQDKGHKVIHAGNLHFFVFSDLQFSTIKEKGHQMCVGLYIGSFVTKMYYIP